MQELKNNRERMVSFSLSGLNNFCRNKEYTNYIFTLAMWPLVLTVKQVDYFANCTSLNSFEQLLHEKQDMDVYYASPRLLQNRNTGKIGAFYTLTEECESIFPIHADGFLNLSGYEIAEGKIQFYIFSENRVMDEICDYEKYVAYMLSHGAVMYDETHMLVPSVTKAQISDMISRIKE